MKKHMTEKDGIYGAFVIGAKNPGNDCSKNLKEAGYNFQHMNCENIERYVVPFNDGSTYQINIVGFLNDRYQLEGVVGVGIDTDKEQLGTTLDNLFVIAGVLPLDQDSFVGGMLYQKLISDLEETIDSYANSLVIKTPDNMN